VPIYGIELKAPSTKRICTMRGEIFSTSAPSFSFVFLPKQQTNPSGFTFIIQPYDLFKQ
jgi:hypothetical protein